MLVQLTLESRSVNSDVVLIVDRRINTSVKCNVYDPNVLKIIFTTVFGFSIEYFKVYVALIFF